MPLMMGQSVRLAAVLLASATIGCAAVGQAIEEEHARQADAEAPMVAAFRKDDGYTAGSYDRLTRGLRHGWGKIKFCERAYQGTSVWTKWLDRLRALGKLDESKRHYFWIDDRFALLSVPLADKAAFDQAAQAGRVCVWVDEERRITIGTGVDLGEMNYATNPVDHVPADRWDGVTQPHSDYQPASAPSAGPAPASAPAPAPGATILGH